MRTERNRVLIVDDEPDLCWTLEEILRSDDNEVISTTSGQCALELAEQGPWAVAFLDAKLPDLDGTDLAKVIRRHNPETAIILISGFFYPEDPLIVEALAQNLFISFVSKPFDIQVVRSLALQAIEAAKLKGQPS